MIDLIKSKKAFSDYLDKYEDKSHISFKAKVKHTYNVSENAKKIATELNLNSDDIKLAELIGLLHDLGRFEELKVTGEYNSLGFDHGKYASIMLFEKNLIRNFIEDDKYDEIIKKAIENHGTFAIEEELDERTLLFCKIIRDADKLDIFRVKKEIEIEGLFPLRVQKKEDIEESPISDIIFETVLKERCVYNPDRKYPLDFLIGNMAYVFDLNYKISFKILKEKNYLNFIIDRFDYKNKISRNRMEEIRKVFSNFIDKKLQ